MYERRACVASQHSVTPQYSSDPRSHARRRGLTATDGQQGHIVGRADTRHHDVNDLLTERAQWGNRDRLDDIEQALLALVIRAALLLDQPVAVGEQRLSGLKRDLHLGALVGDSERSGLRASV